MAGDSSTPSKFRLAIVGSGPIGKLLAATARFHPRMEVVLYEAETFPLRPGFGYGVGPQALRAYSVANEAVGQKILDACVLGPSWMRWWHSGAEDKLLRDVNVPDGMVHGWIGRDELMDVLGQSIPKDVGPVQYGKALTGVTKSESGLELQFKDGSKDSVHAIWACEGINSLCRQVLQGPNFRPPEYSGMLCFRGKVPTETIQASLGEDFAKKQVMFIGTKGWHILTFPIAGGKFVNIATFAVEPEWKRMGREYKPTKEDILTYFPGRNKTADAMLNMLIDEGCQRLELTHLGKLEAFTNSDLHITTFGDSANGMTPHMAGSMSTGIIGVATFIQEWNKRVDALPAESSDTDIANAFDDASRAYEARHKPLAQKIINFSSEQGPLRWSSGNTDYEFLSERFHFIWNASDQL